MKVKKTIAFVSVLLMAWITNCQTISDSADSTNKDASASGVVSMGPFVLENSCRCAGHSDLNGLHSMLAIEINKAKTELCLANQQKHDAERERYDRQCCDSIARAESAIQRQFYELKDLIDLEMNNNENALTWFGILSAIVGILATIFGLIFPFVSEIMRRRNYEKLAKNFDQQKE